MSDPQKTGKTLHRLKIEGDYLDACRNRVWIDGHPVETVSEIDLRMNASGVNQATISTILPQGIDVDVAADVRVDDKTADLLTRLGWIPPLTEPRTFEYPVGVPLTDEEAAELEQRLREVLSKPHTYRVLPGGEPEPQVVRSEDERLISEATTLKPGETLIIRVADLSPPQVQQYQEHLEAMIEHAGLDVRVLIVYGDELAVQQAEGA